MTSVYAIILLIEQYSGTPAGQRRPADLLSYFLLGLWVLILVLISSQHRSLVQAKMVELFLFARQSGFNHVWAWLEI